MCEYIKTKDGIMNAATVRFVETVCGIDKETIIKEADTIEELCDRFIVDYGNDHTIFSRFYDLRRHFELYGQDYHKVKGRYGAIWTDKGLTYVAKMNANGELELLVNMETIKTHRFTRKESDHYVYEKPIVDGNNTVGVYDEDGSPIEKLGELEDIEEEISIDLITLFKALKHGIFAKDITIYHLSGEVSENQRLDPKYLRINLWDECIEWDNIWNPEDGIHQYEFINYGKTWALTKEELQEAAI